MTGMGTTTGLLTFEEFERLPEHDEPGKLELLDGELIRMPPAFFSHMDIAMRLYDLLKVEVARLHSQGLALNLGRVAIETGYHLGASFLIPDVSIIHTGQKIDRYPEGAPALAIEVISKSNTVEEMHGKIACYFANGAKEVWVFHPRTSTATVYFGDRSVEMRGALTSELFPGLSIQLAEIFG